MALIKCPECSKDVSDKAQSCPNCGYELKKSDNIKTESNKISTSSITDKKIKLGNREVPVIVVIFLVIAVGYFIYNGGIGGSVIGKTFEDSAGEKLYFKDDDTIEITTSLGSSESSYTFENNVLKFKFVGVNFEMEYKNGCFEMETSSGKIDKYCKK